jgi:hypothetical protein
MDELYRHLSIAVDRKRPTSEDGERPKWTVGDGMKRFFEPEQREVKCEKCKEGTTATQTHRITSRYVAIGRSFLKFASSSSLLDPFVFPSLQTQCLDSSLEAFRRD